MKRVVKQPPKRNCAEILIDHGARPDSMQRLAYFMTHGIYRIQNIFAITI